jgi:hypothetical protein
VVDWGISLRPIKRALSGMEKDSFPIAHRPGKILLLPAEAGTEVDEFIALGADPRNIVCIERNQEQADRLYEHYFDRCQVHWIDLNSFIERAQSDAYSYAHLDYCGFLGEDELTAICGTARILAPHARLRVSLMVNRKTSSIVNFEDMIRNTMVLPLIDLLASSEKGLGWEEVAEEFTNSSDTLQLVAVVTILSHMFGVQPWDFADLVANTKVLPSLDGKHWIYNVQRWQYHEPGHPPVMETIWMDMIEKTAAPVSTAAQLFPLLHSLLPHPAAYALTLGEVHD